MINFRLDLQEAVFSRNEALIIKAVLMTQNREKVAVENNKMYPMMMERRRDLYEMRIIHVIYVERNMLSLPIEGIHC